MGEEGISRDYSQKWEMVMPTPQLRWRVIDGQLTHKILEQLVTIHDQDGARSDWREVSTIFVEVQNKDTAV